MKIALMVLLLLPQLATAGVYMCVDPVTGKTSFTDKACPTKAAGEEVRVHVANPGSGGRGSRGGISKAWDSQRDSRKSGLDYNSDRRRLYGTGDTPVAANDG